MQSFQHVTPVAAKPQHNKTISRAKTPSRREKPFCQHQLFRSPSWPGLLIRFFFDTDSDTDPDPEIACWFGLVRIGSNLPVAISFTRKRPIFFLAKLVKIAKKKWFPFAGLACLARDRSF